MKKLIHAFLPFAFVLNSSCVHTRSREHVEVQPIAATNADGVISKVRVDGTTLDYVIYRSSELPLHDFFFHLKRGDYKTAFRKMKLNYRPANYEDDVLNELLSAGFVPTYVKVKNDGTTPLQFDEKSFALSYTDTTTKAFFADQLPREFKRFSPKAAVANAYNTAVVVVGFAAVLAAVMVMPMARNPELAPAFGSKPIDSDSTIYNDIHTTVYVDYKKLLISKVTLNSGEETKGLLFFHTGSADLPSEIELTFTPGIEPAAPAVR